MNKIEIEFKGVIENKLTQFGSPNISNKLPESCLTILEKHIVAFDNWKVENNWKLSDYHWQNKHIILWCQPFSSEKKTTEELLLLYYKSIEK